ncbi:1,4-dihydroxy-2-naphthoate octaprenyltransferase [Halomicronema hongdechloris C2206]|uniref:1,4-dihydroxy-2-naphthoate octaprenyltransferase n=1 Tax=Halomicronema hongdechloris C2206 TaxID=1641165 RepID=A0A1Z3HQK4_9CYAN|nr:prenyltransferase [Halomicronema hongdechloris]ASC72578.1 1,4-dihydroxy-2-naphthoate octaprenyltransferase [Halomicronema hongdechloris C2206]
MASLIFSIPKHLRVITDRGYHLFRVTIVYSNIWVAAAIASLVVFVQDTLGLDWQWAPVLLIFASALIPYNLDRIADSYVQEIPDGKAQAYFQQGWGWVVLIAATAATGILLYYADRSVLLVSLGGLVPLIYGLPLFPWWRQHRLQWWRLKDIPASKAWLVAGIITYALIAVPLAYAHAPFTLSAGLTSFFLLIFIGTNSHLFDVRDLESDRQAGVLTLPLLVGLSNHRQIWTALNLVALAVVGWGWLQHLSVPSPLVAIPCVAANLIAIWLIRPATPRPLYSLCIDGYLWLPSLIVAVIRAFQL